MIRIVILCILSLMAMLSSAYAGIDAAAIIAALERQTGEQRVWHLAEIQKMVESLYNLRAQLTHMQEMLSIERWRKEGIEVLNAISNIPNTWIEGTAFPDGIEADAENLSSLQGEWHTVFGNTQKIFESIDSVSGTIEGVFKNMEVADKTNTNTYAVGDSFQKKYVENSAYSQKLAGLAKTVNEKGALRMIAEELAKMLEIQNQVVYLLGQMLKNDSVEYSNESLARKEKIAEFEAECEGVKRFMKINNPEEFRVK